MLLTLKVAHNVFLIGCYFPKVKVVVCHTENVFLFPLVCDIKDMYYKWLALVCLLRCLPCHEFVGTFSYLKEIVGGMLDAEPTLWRKPHNESFEDQRKKVLQFAEWWKPYDWTQTLVAVE